MDHLTWPDAFAAACFMAAFASMFYFVARAHTGIPETSLPRILRHRERMAKRSVPDFGLRSSSPEWSVKRSPVSEVFATPAVLDDLIKSGAAQKQPDGSYALAFERHADGTVKLLVHGKPVPSPEPEAKTEA